MKILILNPNIWMGGGAQKALIRQALGLQELGHQVFILTTRIDRRERPDILNRLNITVADIPLVFYRDNQYLPLENKLVLLRNFFRLKKAIKKFVRQHQIDIVNPQQTPMHWLCGGLSVPVVWTCYEPISLWPSNKPYFIIGAKKLTVFGRLARYIFENFDRRYVRRHVRNIIAISEMVQRDIKILYGLSARVAYLPVDTELLATADPERARRRLNIKSSDFVVTQVAHLKPVKNQRCTIDTAKLLLNKISNLKILLVGGGPDHQPLLDYANRQGLADRTIFVGPQTDIQTADCLAASNVLILPARHQTWGLVIFEALSAGALPVVANDCGARVVIEKEKIGLLSEPRPESFAAMIFKAYSDKEKMAELVQRGKKYTQRYLSYTGYAQKIDDIFREIVNKAS